MPDLLSIVHRRWRLLLLMTFAGTAVALLGSFISPKLYLGTTTALPVNSQLNDKAHIFNSNIEALYSEIGTASELDKLEGTAHLDTLFLAVVDGQHLVKYYGLNETAADAREKAVLRLRRVSEIKRTSYGEFNVKVWDENPATAAALANALLQTINAIHEQLQTENNKAVLQKLQSIYAQKLQSQTAIVKRLLTFDTITVAPQKSTVQPEISMEEVGRQQVALTEELTQYRRLIGEYEVALQTAPKSLLVVERARPMALPDRPKTTRNVLLAFVASLLFSFLLAIYFESSAKQ